MEAIRRIVKISDNNEIIIKVPDHIPKNEPVEVILLLKDKSELLKESDNTPQIPEQLNSKQIIKDQNLINSDRNAVSNSGSETYYQKIKKMREAMNDKLFLEDIAEVSEDYKYVDLEGWEE
jgi:hypothetical protein